MCYLEGRSGGDDGRTRASPGLVNSSHVLSLQSSPSSFPVILLPSLPLPPPIWADVLERLAYSFVHSALHSLFGSRGVQGCNSTWGTWGPVRTGVRLLRNGVLCRSQWGICARTVRSWAGDAGMTRLPALYCLSRAWRLDYTCGCRASTSSFS